MTPDAVPILSCEHVSHAYHTLTKETAALKDISFQVMEGSFLSIVGPSGCGKSTLLNILCGLLKPDAGNVFFQNVRLEKPDPRIGYMLQKDHLFEWRCIYKNVCLGLELQKMGKDVKHKERVDELLNKYGLYEFRNVKPSQLSGGMRQRAALIRTLALEPKLLLLDEPFSALDYQTRLSVSDDIGRILKAEKKTAILVTHDLAEAISLGDQVVILSKRPGKVKKTVPIHFSIKDRTPFTSRNAPEFKDYFQEIWKELNAYEGI